jgi:hypothetical protein
MYIMHRAIVTTDAAPYSHCSNMERAKLLNRYGTKTDDVAGAVKSTDNIVFCGLTFNDANMLNLSRPSLYWHHDP